MPESSEVTEFAGVEFTEQGLSAEWVYGERVNERRHAAVDSIVKRMHTVFFDSAPTTSGTSGSASGSGGITGDIETAEIDPENSGYETVTRLVPQMVYGTPRAELEGKVSPVESPEDDEVKLLQHAWNTLAKDTAFLGFMDQTAPDLIISEFIALVTSTRDDFTYSPSTDEENWPGVQRLSWRNFVRDPQSLEFESCKWLSHRWVMSKDEVIAQAKANPEEGWDLEALEDMGGLALSEDYRPKPRPADAPRRGELEFVEMWWPGFELDDETDFDVENTKGSDKGFYGTIFTLAILRTGGAGKGDNEADTVSRFVRKPRPYYGFRDGPYVVAGVTRVPDDPYFLSPLIATEWQARELNAHLRATYTSARHYKRIQVFTGDDMTFAEKVKTGDHDYMFHLRDLPGDKRAADQFETLEFGGITEQNLATIEMLREALWRNLGMGESGTGNPSSETATAVAVANQGASIRTDRVLEVWRDALAQVAIRQCFYLATNKDVKLFFSSKETEQAGLASTPGEMFEYRGGGLTPKEFMGLGLKIDVLSVQRMTDAQRQQTLLQAHGLVLQAIPMIAQYPIEAFWIDYFNQVGDGLDVPNLGETLRPFVTGALAMLMQQPPEQGGGEQRTPNVSVSGNGAGPVNRTPGLSGVEQTTPLPAMPQMAQMGGLNGNG